MRVLADRFALGHRPDHGRAEILRVRAGEANATDALDRSQARRSSAKSLLRTIAPVGVDVLAEQRDLAHAVAGQARHLGDDLARTAALLAAAHGRDDAVRALRVAAHRDLHPRLEAPLALPGQAPGEAPLVQAEGTRSHAVAARAEPFPEMRDRAGPEGHVHVRVEREEPLPLCLGVAAPDGDHLVRVALLERTRLRQVSREALVGLLADRAGVEDEHVRLFLAGASPSPSSSSMPLIRSESWAFI